jgi:anthranilate phosphoribosyltransferase
MKEILLRLAEHENLSREEACNILLKMGSGQFNESQIAAFITVYMMRSITVEELSGFRDALLEQCLRIDLSDFNTLDIVGTGGDNKNTFNISTLSSFVVAGTGGKVAKHGNYGATSTSGASNVLEFYGCKFTSDESKLKQSIDQSGVAFLHAPLFNPAMKVVAPVRKSLGVRTFYNVLGPLVNPSFPKNQLLGVYSLKLARLYNYLYQTTSMNYAIVHSLDGYDEISLTSNWKLINSKGEYLLNPSELHLLPCKQEELYGGATIPDAAKIFMNVLENKATKAQTEVVVANAATGLQLLNNEDFAVACGKARESIASGNALACFKKFIALNS